MSMRKIPKTMATQHPDNANVHPFSGKAFVTTQEEVEECHYSFSKLDCQEFMWDWEGKHVDESVVDKLVESHSEYFSKNQLGRDIFLTFRIPNIWMEKGYRVARAFANLIAANDLMEELGWNTPPLFELILPMTTSAQKLFFLRSKYSEIVKAFEFLKEAGPADVSLIPLVEETNLMMDANKLLEEYVRLCNQSAYKKYENPYLRPFLARSDPALNSGLVPAVISVKAALSRFAQFSETSGIATYPIIGVGSLPFRGGISPNTIKEFEEEYAGVRTVTVQSAFRVDFGEEKAIGAIDKLNEGLNLKAKQYSDEEYLKIRELESIFSRHYLKTIEQLSEIGNLAKFVPARRERKLHIGLLGYGRPVGKVHLPRAIAFTCALYSVGVPPEFIGTGRGLKEASEKGLLDFLLENYRGISRELLFAGEFLNRENLKTLAASNPAWEEIANDAKICEEILGLKFVATNEDSQMHGKITTEILKKIGKGENASGEYQKAAELRKSLG